MTDATARRALAFLRVTMGALLVWQVLPRLDRMTIEQLPAQLDLFAQANPVEPYRWVLHNIAIPHAEQLAPVLCVGQLLVGIALVMGFLTRLTTVVALLYTVNLALAMGHLGFYNAAFGVSLAVMFLTLWVGDAGRCYGVDQFIFREEPPAKQVKKVQKMKFKDKKQKAVVEKLAKEVKKSSAGKKKRAKSAVGADDDD